MTSYLPQAQLTATQRQDLLAELKQVEPQLKALQIMMQDMIDRAGHYAWRAPGYLSE